MLLSTLKQPSKNVLLPLFYFLLLKRCFSNDSSFFTTLEDYKCEKVDLLVDPITIQNKNYLLETLLDKSSTNKYYKTEIGNHSNNSVVTGMFICTGKLSQEECSFCIHQIVGEMTFLCPEDPSNLRILLTGCLLRYTSPYYTESKLEFDVGCSQMLVGKPLLSESSETAFTMLLNESSRDGSFEAMQQRVTLQAQCPNSMRRASCLRCITAAWHVGQVLCTNVTTGYFYFEHCFMKYEYDLTEQFAPPPAGDDQSMGIHKPPEKKKKKKHWFYYVGPVLGVVVALSCLAFCQLQTEQTRKCTEWCCANAIVGNDE